LGEKAYYFSSLKYLEGYKKGKTSGKMCAYYKIKIIVKKNSNKLSYKL